MPEQSVYGRSLQHLSDYDSVPSAQVAPDIAALGYWGLTVFSEKPVRGVQPDDKEYSPKNETMNPKGV